MHKLFPASRWHLKNHFANLRFVVTSARSRQYTDAPNPDSELDIPSNDVLGELESSKPINPIPRFAPGMENNFHRTGHSESAAAQISHPWSEWVDLMVLLSKGGYFDAEGNPFQNVELGPKESNLIRTACLNFARDRYDVMRYLSKKHIQVIAECGCPSTDRKVVNSGKRLRAHVGSVRSGRASTTLMIFSDVLFFSSSSFSSVIESTIVVSLCRPSFGIAFDIDGMVLLSHAPVGGSPRVLRRLYDDSAKAFATAC